MTVRQPHSMLVIKGALLLSGPMFLMRNFEKGLNSVPKKKHMRQWDSATCPGGGLAIPCIKISSGKNHCYKTPEKRCYM